MNRMLILMTLAAGLAAAGCSQAPPRGRERQPLPFVVKLKRAEVDSVEKVIASNPRVSIPMNYGDPEEFTRELARSLGESGTFELVVTDDDQGAAGLAPDLEMEVSVKGNDFGPGEPKIAMSLFSTVTWLFAGHLSWLIPDREYPNSSVKLSVVIRKPAAQGSSPEGAARSQESLFADTVVLKDLDLSFSERAQRRNWVLNVVVPPCWGDGDPKVAGTSLARKSIGYFVSQVSGSITSRLPSGYFDKQSSFLHYDRERGEILVVSQVRVVRMDGLPSEGRRALSRDDLAAFGVKAEDRESVESRLAEVEGFGIGTGPNYFYYRIPVKEESWECARITATPENTPPCAWTVYREAGKAATSLTQVSIPSKSQS